MLLCCSMLGVYVFGVYITVIVASTLREDNMCNIRTQCDVYLQQNVTSD